MSGSEYAPCRMGNLIFSKLPKSEGRAEIIIACKACRDLLKSFDTINIFFLSQLYLSCISVGQILPANRNTPSPIDPETIQVPVGYEPDPADLALSSIPGQEMFDPRKRKFSEEELKPQPMIKKARKVFIPDDLKVIWNWWQSDSYRVSGSCSLRYRFGAWIYFVM